MNLDQRLQVMQAASTIFAARISARSAAAASGRAMAIQPPPDNELLKHCVELVLHGLANKDIWPDSKSATFHALNF